MPRFTKTLEELETKFDKWLYVIQNLPKLDRLPGTLKETVFEKFFEAAAIAKLNQEELRAYEDSLKYYRDLKNSLDTAFDEGVEKGIEKGMEKVAKTGIANGYDNLVIQQLTGLSTEKIEKLRKQVKI